MRELEALVSKEDQLGLEIEEEDLEEQEKLNQSLKRLDKKILTYLVIEKAKLSTDSEGKKRLSLSFDTEASWKRFISKIKD